MHETLLMHYAHAQHSLCHITQHRTVTFNCSQFNLFHEMSGFDAGWAVVFWSSDPVGSR